MGLDLRPLGIADVATVVSAVVAYLVFIAVASALRIGRGRKPSVPFNRTHFRMVWFYIAFASAALWLSGVPLSFRWASDLVVGAFFYFGFHYAIFANFFGMAHASVSTSIISIVFRKGGRATRAEIVNAYASGEGFEYIKRSRLDRLEHFLGWIERAPDDANRYRVTARGLKAIRTTRFFLKAWSLTQLGAKP
jgi:hypothetical protein